MKEIKTEILKMDMDWTGVRNECRTTVNKDDIETEVSDSFKRSILLAQHSPVRLLRIRWRWDSIKSWISTHYARHHIGVEKWISTQRDDRTGRNRDKAPQGTFVRMDMEANAQALINMAKLRLCYQAHPETRQYMESLKKAVYESGERELASVMVPQCVCYYGCNEMKPCGFFKKFSKYCWDNQIDITDIQKRYDAYNEFIGVFK